LYPEALSLPTGIANLSRNLEKCLAIKSGNKKRGSVF
jgi:hypothetical protein